MTNDNGCLHVHFERIGTNKTRSRAGFKQTVRSSDILSSINYPSWKIALQVATPPRCKSCTLVGEHKCLSVFLSPVNKVRTGLGGALLRFYIQNDSFEKLTIKRRSTNHIKPEYYFSSKCPNWMRCQCKIFPRVINKCIYWHKKSRVVYVYLRGCEKIESYFRKLTISRKGKSFKCAQDLQQ